METGKFYDVFHSNALIQTKVINNNNYTYSIIISILNRLISQSHKLTILDYGCGVGTIDLYLANKGHRVTGTDISPKAIKIASQSSKILGLNSTTTFIGLDKFKHIPNKYDFVICLEVLEHVKNDFEVLRDLYSCTKKGGTILISVPSERAPLHKLGLAKSFDHRVGHLRRYNAENITKITQSSGFTVVKLIKKEGILRNSLFVLKPFGVIIKFIKGPISKIFTKADDISKYLLGESDIFIIARKK